MIKASTQHQLKRLYGKLKGLVPEARVAFLEGVLYGLDKSDLALQEVNEIYEIYHMSANPMRAIEQYIFGDEG